MTFEPTIRMTQTNPPPTTATPSGAALAGLLVRQLLTLLAGLLVAHGYNEAQVQGWSNELQPIVLAAVLAGGSAAWSYINKRIHATKLLAAENTTQSVVNQARDAGVDVQTPPGTPTMPNPPPPGVA